MKRPILLPFCRQYSDQWLPSGSSHAGNYTTASLVTSADVPADHRTVWETLHSSCQRSSNVVLGFAAVFIVVCTTLNLLAIFTAIHVKVEESLTKEDEDSIKRRSTYKKSLWAMLLCSLALSGLIASCVLVPALMVAAYEMLFFSETEDAAARLTLSKQVSLGVFHFVVSLSLYSILGAVCERWVALISIKPHEYLCKVSNPVMDLKNKMKLNKKSPENEPSCFANRIPLITYLLFSLGTSTALAVVSVIYGQERFLLYGDDLRIEQLHPLSSYLTIPDDRIHAMSVLYLVLLFVPAVSLVICFAAAAVALMKTRSNAMRLTSYQQAQARVYCKSRSGSKSNDDSKPMKTDRLAKNPSLRIGPNGVQTVSSRENVCYSHKQEHAAQVTSNCQEVDLSGVITDSIQMQQDGAANKTYDSVRLPPPPEWLKFSSIKRSDTISSAVKVDDLATTPLSVPYDSAVSFFGEIAQTKATLGTYAVVFLLMLPLYSLLAIDVFADPDGLLGYRLNGISSKWQDTLFHNMRVVSFTTTDFSVMLLFLYLFAGSLPFILMLSFSQPYSRAAKSCLRKLCCLKAKPKKETKSEELDILKAGSSRRRKTNVQDREENSRRDKRTPRISWMNNHAEYWQSFSRRSNTPSERPWHPSQRPRSSYIENIVNIDERFEADA